MDRRTPTGLSGRIPLAVIIVDDAGLVSHWSTGARRLFGRSRRDAVGRPAVDLLPVVGALEGAAGQDSGSSAGRGVAYPSEEDYGRSLEASLAGAGSYPTAGRARLFEPQPDAAAEMPGGAADGPHEIADGALDVLWWAYPLVGPGPERLLVLAADAGRLEHGGPDAAAEACSGSHPVLRCTPSSPAPTDSPSSSRRSCPA